MFRKGGKSDKRVKRFLWRWNKPAWALNQGIWLPCNQPGITPGIARQIYFGEYESKEIAIISNTLSANDTVVEVGAGIGYVSAFCAQRIGNERVHTFEANPALIPLIEATHQRNGISPNVLNALLARGNGECTFYVEPEFWASSATKISRNSKPIVVPQRDLNEEFARLRPTFLIVDIEGGESDFFAYADLSGVNKICIDTHPGLLGNTGITTVVSSILNQGFVLDFGCIQKNVFFFYRP